MATKKTNEPAAPPVNHFSHGIDPMSWSELAFWTKRLTKDDSPVPAFVVRDLLATFWDIVQHYPTKNLEGPDAEAFDDCMQRLHDVFERKAPR